ncbi:E1 [Tursiops truncatus papillomavirus 4]|uniref:Replication protein E1 n=1 Tax=Tursiops truncatus papillomavirus 4 TaxID=1144380 RepID=H6UYN3_9PAPI|nr:E1 [Tursiops truncatus papillomavirus 4]
MDTSPGTDHLEGGSNDWVLIEATDVGGCGGEEEEEDEDDDSDAEDMVDFIDDSIQVQNAETQDYYRSLQLQQQRVDDERAVQVLKRKFFDSPKSKVDSDLSPRLAAITLQEKQRRGRARRRLYKEGEHGDSLEDRSEESMDTPNGQVLTKEVVDTVMVGEGARPKTVGNVRSTQEVECAESSEDYTSSVTQLLRAGKPRALLLAMFKEVFGCSFTDLTRCFKSDKTVNDDWTCLIVGVPCSLEGAITDLLKPLSVFSHVTTATCKYGLLVLVLAQWKTSKCRDTVTNLLSGLLSVEKQQILCEPPKVRHPGAAMFWYKKGLSSACVVTGEMPGWILKQVSLQDQLGEMCQFSLSHMIQWAYDNGHETEEAIAYEYAALADEDKNAEAFLRSNGQAKYVKDCANMVKLYRRAEMKKMGMGQWIKHKCDAVDGDGDWRHVMNFLKFQGIEIMSFLIDLRLFLKGVPKKNCLVLFGPPNTGKSMFAMSLISLLGGKVLSYVNSNSHFWLQPLLDTKIALIDDATPSTWDYTDTYLRNALDGNPISLDTKHRAPIQITCPPLIITTNSNVLENPKWKYLHSRVKMYSFLNECPLNSRGDPEFQLNKVNWKGFLTKCWSKLSLDEGNEGHDGSPLQPLRCVARDPNGTD